MTIQLLETVVFEGRELTAVVDTEDECCTHCVGCQESGPGNQCHPANRTDGNNVFFMDADDALKARLRGRIG